MNPPAGADGLPDIKDIAGPEPLPDFWEILGAAGLAVLGIAVAAWLIRLVARHLSARRLADSPLAAARRRLDALERQASDLAPNAFSVAVSDTLKDYLSRRYGDPVRYETSEEFLLRLSRSGAASLPPATRDALAGFLSVADEIKYGRPPDAEARKPPLLVQAREVIREPAPGPAPAASSGPRRRRPGPSPA